MPYHVRELLVYTLVTCMIYCVCARAFSSSRWLILIVAILLTFAAAMFIVFGLAIVFDGWFVWVAELWFIPPCSGTSLPGAQSVMEYPQPNPSNWLATTMFNLLHA